ncbi:hypothetical protein GCM10008939_02430 [Deinococcus aquiradiocola]|uniref:Esterase n=1 Tax=Deinococcus aquiradiocola TaxID=393059 RepID=A0A917P540_9DEIO|nr:hypothetical protein GCM10008939_02430 [Deinococcus aquiradiocola]
MTGEGFVQTFILGSLPDGTPGAAFALVTAQDGWDAGRADLRFALEDDRFVLRRAYPAGTLLSFKVTRGSAQSEEGDAWGQRRPDRRHEVTGDAVHVLDVQSWMDGPSVPRPSSVTGVTWTHALHSPELGDALTVTVWVPPGYSGGTARFPVLYLHDGQNVLDRRTAFAGEEWACDEAAHALALAGLPCLLVAVTVRGEHRAEDYVPFGMEANGFTSSADAYQAFLAGTLKSFVDATYRTVPDAAHTALAGSSFGGLASLYGGLSRPGVWGTVGAFSPSLWVRDGGGRDLFGPGEGGRGMVEWCADHPSPTSRVYVDMGTREGTTLAWADSLVAHTRHFADVMAGRVREVQLVIAPGDHHDERAWAARFPGFLRWWLEGLPDA